MLRLKRSSLLALFCLALAATGCGSDPNRSPETKAVADAINSVFYHAKWRQVPAEPENQAETLVFEQRIPFADDATTLDQAGLAAIDHLLAEAKPGRDKVISLSVPAQTQGATQFDQLTTQRLEAVRQALADRGYDSSLASSESGQVATLSAGEIGLKVAKVMAILPDCDQPQPLEPNKPDFVSAYGCSNANNLGVMVANPADLEQGRTLEPADGETAATSILRYRTRKTEPLEKQDTKSQ